MKLAANSGGRPRAERDEVAHAASHELRAPVVAIGQIVDSIQEDFAAELPPEVSRRLVILREKAGRLDAVLKGLNCYQRAGRPYGRVRPVDLKSIVGEVSRDLDVSDATVAVVDDASVPAPRKALQKVIHELLDNALRHAERRDARIEVSARTCPGGWELRVSDNGPGIGPGYRERVWSPFETLKPRGGSGLGLAIARRIVEAHGGRTWIEDAPGGGARVCVFWPS